MSNLSDLLPAGAAAKQLTFTDSGSGIATKKPVILNSDGTVAEVGMSTLPIAVGSAIDFSGGTATGLGYYASVCYDTANDKIFIAYRDQDNSSYGTGVVCTVSGTTLSVGTPVVFSSNLTSYTSCCFDSSNNKVFVAYQNSSAQGEAVVATISGTSVSYGSSGRIDGGGSNKGNYIEAVFDANAGKVFTAYYDSYNGSAYGTVHTISGTSFSSGSPAMFVGYNYPLGQTYDSTAQKIITTIQTGVSTLFSVSVTISGTSWSNGTYLSIGPCNGNADVSYDPVQDKTLQYFNDSTANTGKVAVLSLSGTTLSSGSQVDNTGSGEGYIKSVYNAASASHVIIWSTGSAGQARDVTISGTTPTLNATTTDWSSDYLDYIGAAYDEDQKVTVIATANSVAPKCYAIAYQSSYEGTNLEATNFVGVADSAISSSAAGSVIVQGGTVTGPTAEVTIAESLSSAFLYAQDAPADPVAAAASATGSSNLLIAYYVNDGVTQGARVQAATISSGSISYGSSDVIGAASSDIWLYAIANTSSNNKFVVFWHDQSDSYIYGAVVTLTGSSISYGATTAVYSSAVINNYDTFNATYDPDTDRVILGVCDNSDTYAYSVVIEIGSTTIDTVGTPAKIDSSSAANGYAKKIDLCYDTTEDKVIATYANVGGGGSYYLRVAAGTVTGGATNSISWGSSSVVYSGDVTYPRCAYNATDQRVVIVYKQAADAKGYSSVATVSGTTVTANTPSVFYDPTSTGGWVLYYTSVAHDSYMNKMVIYMRASAGDAVYGAIDTSANSIAWSSVYNVSADAYNPPQTEFDVGTNQVILLGAGTTKATAESYIYTVPGTISGQPLTVGTKYYVTTSGTFSSSADTPSVNAGLAISTTSLLLNGDS